MPRNVLLTFNPGSSSIKLGLFKVQDGVPRAFGRGAIDLRHVPLSLHLEEGGRTSDVTLESAATDDLHEVLEEALGRLTLHFGIGIGIGTLQAAAHRVVHGGDRFDGPVRIDDDTLAAIDALVPMAPLHQPQSLRLIRALRRLRPDLPQTASFDTAFHRTQTDLVRRFALPRALFDEGIKRYGFHGLSYKFIAAETQRLHPQLAAGRVVVAHLGSGASLCGLHGGVSRDTTMSFSTLDGIPMATRGGALDPGVLLHLQKVRGLSLDALEDMLYHRSGLLGVSGISADARELAASDAPEAREALALLALRVAREVAAVATTLGGLDALVFTGGIGEHQPAVRDAICRHLEWLGKVPVLVLHTDEEQVIAEEACHVLHPSTSGTSS